MWQRLALRHGKEFVKHVGPAVIKPARTLWNEVIGFFFLVFAVIFGSRAVGFLKAYVTGAEADKGATLVRLGIILFPTVLMLWFGVSSFLRARRISRS